MSRHPARSFALAALVASGALLASAGPASAHASIQLYGEKAYAGKGAVIFIRIGHADPGKSSTKIDVQIPEGVTSVKPQRIGGWTEATTPTADGKNVATVSWSGGSLPDSSFQDFGIKVTFPKTPGVALPFKVVQTLNDGSQIAWIELAAPGGAEPTHPAPTVVLVDPAATSAVAPPTTAAAPSIAAELTGSLSASKTTVRLLADTSTVNAGKRYTLQVRGGSVLSTGTLDARGDVIRIVKARRSGASGYAVTSGSALELVIDGKVVATSTVG